MSKLLLLKKTPTKFRVSTAEVTKGELFYLDKYTKSINWDNVVVDWKSSSTKSIMIDSSGNVGISELNDSGFFSLRGWIDSMDAYTVNPLTTSSSSSENSSNVLPKYVYKIYEK